MNHVFISHATKDDDTVTRIHDTLEADTGREMWVDHKDLKPPKTNWRADIHKALRESAAGLLVLSRNSVSRPEIVSEWTYLLNTKHDLYVAKIDDVPIDDVDYRLHIVQWVDLSKEWDAGMTALAAYIREGTVSVDAPVILVRPISGQVERKLLHIPISGRDEDLKIIQSKLRRGPTSIVGVGGLGKSRLAAEIVMTSEGIQGAVWHTASDLSRPDEVVELLRDHLGLAVTASRQETLAKLRTHKRLVVIDNAESVPEDARREEYVRLLRDLHDAGAQVLLTSRNEWADDDTWGSHHPPPLPLEAAKQVVLDMQTAFDARDLSAQAEDLARAAR
jgi:hypothetical protein